MHTSDAIRDRAEKDRAVARKIIQHSLNQDMPTLRRAVKLLAIWQARWQAESRFRDTDAS